MNVRFFLIKEESTDNSLNIPPVHYDRKIKRQYN